MGVTGTGSPNLKWEKNKAFNLGLDVTLWERPSLTVDYYTRKTSGLLANKRISYVPGYYDPTSFAPAALQNVGSLEDEGIEFSLSSTNPQTQDLIWTTTFNIGHNKNKLVKLDGIQTDEIDGALIHHVDEPYYSYYMFEYAGVDPKTGSGMYYKNNDINETTTLTSEAQKVVVGHHDSKVEGGSTSFLKWKFTDLNLTLIYSLGGKAIGYATWLHDNDGTYTSYGAISSYYKLGNMWKKEGDSAKLSKLKYGNSRVFSPRWLMSTDYLCLKSLSSGFSAPRNLLSKMGISEVRVYFSANNLLTWKSKDLLVDPEMPVDGLCTFEIPALKMYIFGIEIGS